MPLIDVGKKAPAFTLKDQHGVPHKLSQYAGSPVILYFYPKDDTPGCTTESCDFQERLPKFAKAGGAVVLGVSIVDEKSKAKFANKHGLTFPLLADAEHEVAEKYGVWQEKMRYGRKVARGGPRQAGRSLVGRAGGVDLRGLPPAARASVPADRADAASEAAAGDHAAHGGARRGGRA